MFTMTGAALTAAGVGITAVLTISAKAAADEEANIARLSAALSAVGQDYDRVSGSLEKMINAQQLSTGFADDQQRDALSALIPIVGNLDEATKLLGLSMDLARWKGMDLASAAEIIGKVAGGNTGILSRYGIIIEKGASSTEALAKIQSLAAGQAEAYGKTVKGQMDALSASFGDMQEAIGTALLPTLAELVKTVLPLVEQFKNWAVENPELMKTLVLTAGAAGLLMSVIGPLLMMMPGIISLVGAFSAGGAFAGVGAALSGIGPALAGIGAAILPVLPVVLAFAAAIGGVLFFVYALVTEWDRLGQLFGIVGDIIRNNLNIAINQARIFFVQARDAIVGAWNNVVQFFTNIVNGIKTAFDNVVNWITQPFKDAWAQIQQIANNISSAWNGLFSGGTGTATTSVPVRPFASGGIVTSPTVGLVGEAGPEAVIPLGAFSQMQTSLVVNVGNYMGDEVSKRSFVRDLQRILREEGRRREYRPAETQYYSVGGHL